LETCSVKRHGPWQIIESHEVYRDPWVAVRRDNVIRPDGKPGTHSVVMLKPGVTVLAIDDETNVYLTEEFHYGVGRITIEAVSGGIEPGEALSIHLRPVWFHRRSFTWPGSCGSVIKRPKEQSRSVA
jgi:hypothetical protein